MNTVLVFFLLLSNFQAWSQQEPFKVKVKLSTLKEERELKSWTLEELKPLKYKRIWETPFTGGQKALYAGPRFEGFLDEALKGLPLEQRAKVDLIILKSKEKEIRIPRYLIRKYPAILAVKKGKKRLLEKGPVAFVMPKETTPGLKKEWLPENLYSLASVTQVEFSQYEKYFGEWVLKNRSNPSALRGEKRFVQTCMGCHLNRPIGDLSPYLEKIQSHPQTWHPASEGAPSVNRQFWRGIQSFVKEWVYQK
ncbi:MAG: hypothetical protein CL678_18645 [Bdellovibrionaceae bacterium]|nr:hypothetical protein [Pseudobdellovibrionaceae bacterium]|tara:strand:- start:3080 stop:3832 length:753 start_codon:yes stop_codon:yes gene_type:complete